MTKSIEAITELSKMSADMCMHAPGDMKIPSESYVVTFMS